MYPVLLPHRLLAFKILPSPRDLAPADFGRILLLRIDGEWVTHRCVQWKGQYRTKGDWSEQLDEKTLVWGHLLDHSSIGFVDRLLARISVLGLHGGRLRSRIRRLMILGVVGLCRCLDFKYWKFENHRKF